MANLLTRFKKTVVGASGTIADYTTKIISSGDFRRIRDLEVIINSWNNILLTPRGSYVFDPEYGSNMYRLVFQPADERTVEEIRREVELSLIRYDDRAAINDISISFFRNLKGFNVSIEFEYEGVEGEVEIGFDKDQYTRFLEVTD
jgi:phage baseplate assembly protein W